MPNAHSYLQLLILVLCVCTTIVMFSYYKTWLCLSQKKGGKYQKNCSHDRMGVHMGTRRTQIRRTQSQVLCSIWPPKTSAESAIECIARIV
jgi:hypothetical protein